MCKMVIKGKIRKLSGISCTTALLAGLFDSGGLPHFTDDYRRICSLLNRPDNAHKQTCIENIQKMYDKLPAHHRIVLAQRLDYSSHIMLSRAGCTVSDYLPTCHLLTPGPTTSTLTLSNQLKDVLRNLAETTADPCAKFYTDDALQISKRTWSPEEELLWLGDQDSADAAVAPPRPDIRKVLVKLRALLAHSADQGQCHRMSLAGVPKILWQLWAHFGDETEMAVVIRTTSLQILSNLVLAGKIETNAVFQGGWLPVIRPLVNSPRQQLEMSLMCTKLLANMQYMVDERTTVSYPECVHILHEPIKQADVHTYGALAFSIVGGVEGSPLTTQEPLIDVVFVHGLRGGIFRSWRQKDLPNPTVKVRVNAWWAGAKAKETHQEGRTRCWPRDWLPLDVHGPVRILGIDYTSSVSDWTAPCPYDACRLSIQTRAEVLRERLLSAGLGRRPIIWVGHSMGGLLVKHILCRSIDDHSGLVDKTLGCIFMATPHKGTNMATKTMSSRSRHLLLPSVEIGLIREDHPDLLKLDHDFGHLVKCKKFAVLNAAETLKTAVKLANVPLGTYMLVPENSSKTYIDGKPYGKYIRIDESHHNVSKPTDKDAQIYKIVVDFVNRLIN